MSKRTLCVMGIVVVTVSLAAVSLSTGAASAEPANQESVKVSLEGEAITVAELDATMETQEVYCHSVVETTMVTCFLTVSSLEEDLKRNGVDIAISSAIPDGGPVEEVTDPSTLPPTPSEDTATSTRSGCAYVTLYDGIDSTGSSYTLCSDRPNLGVVGWDNRASSFRTYSSEALLCQDYDYRFSCLKSPPNGGVPDLSTFGDGSYNKSISSVKKL